MTNEVVASWSPSEAGQLLARSIQGAHRAYPELAGYSQGFFPGASPYLPLNLITSGWGQGGPGNLWAPAMDVYAHNDALNFSEKLTKIAGAHGLKFGFAAERGRKQQNFQNDEIGLPGVRSMGHRRHRQRARRHADRPSRDLSSGHPDSRRSLAVLELRHVRAGQLEAEVELHARVRRPRRLLDEQRRAARPRWILRSVVVQRVEGHVPRSRARTSS